MTGSRGFAGVVVITMVVAVAPVAVAALDLTADAVAGWNQYVAALERRRNAERPEASRFLALDFDREAAANRRALLAGEIVTSAIEGPDGGGHDVEVPDAIVHHWRGAVFLPRVSLPALMASLERDAPSTGPDVLRASVVGRGPGTMRLFLRLQRTRFVTVVYNTEHAVRFAHDGADRASSVSVAVKIAEVADPGTPREHEMSAAEDHGYLWRLNAYWRYETVPGGVIAECESISLSRSVPFGLQYLAGPLIRSAARESMERTLDALRIRAGTVVSDNSVIKPGV